MKNVIFLILLGLSFTSFAQKTQLCNAIATYTAGFAEARINGESKSQMQRRVISHSDKMKKNQPNDIQTINEITDSWMSGIEWVFSNQNLKLTPEQTWDKKFNECMNELRSK
jgi:hypothetical protein